MNFPYSANCQLFVFFALDNVVNANKTFISTSFLADFSLFAS
jgi:hypothetical protein